MSEWRKDTSNTWQSWDSPLWRYKPRNPGYSRDSCFWQLKPCQIALVETGLKVNHNFLLIPLSPMSMHSLLIAFSSVLHTLAYFNARNTLYYKWPLLKKSLIFICLCQIKCGMSLVLRSSSICTISTLNYIITWYSSGANLLISFWKWRKICSCSLELQILQVWEQLLSQESNMFLHLLE